MKKLINIFAFLLAVAVLLSGCGSKDSGTGDSSGLDDVTEDYVEDLSVEADISAMDFDFSNRDSDASFNAASAVSVVLSGSDATISGGGAEFSGGSLKITGEGTYILSGSLNSGMIIVEAADTAKIQLVLNGLTVANSGGNAMYIKSADKVFLTLADGSVNSLSDGADYTYTDGETNVDAALFSKSDLCINGGGTLNVSGNCKHAVISKDDLVIVGATVGASSKKVGLGGKDCVKIDGANITVNAGSDGIRSDNTEDSNRGFIYVKSGNINITSTNDAMQAATALKIENISFTAKTGGGSANASTNYDGSMNNNWGFGGRGGMGGFGGYNSTTSESTESAKALKAGNSVIVSGGSYNIDSADDSVHSNKTIEISGGEFNISSGDDGMHADESLTVSAGKIAIAKSYEGLEATNVLVSGGNISILASDDGINAAGGTDSSAIGGRPGQGSFSASNGSIKITGGTVYIKMSGDGLDANGTLSVTGGNITVSGANSGDSAILDFDSSGTISGGTFIGTGATSMAQNFSTSSTQGVIMVSFGNKTAGTEVTLKNSSGSVIVSHTADQAFSCVIISHSSIKKGESYTLTVGTTEATVTMNSTVYGSTGGGMQGGFGRGF